MLALSLSLARSSARSLARTLACLRHNHSHSIGLQRAATVRWSSLPTSVSIHTLFRQVVVDSDPFKRFKYRSGSRLRSSFTSTRTSTPSTSSDYKPISLRAQVESADYGPEDWCQCSAFRLKNSVRVLDGADRERLSDQMCSLTLLISWTRSCSWKILGACNTLIHDLLLVLGSRVVAVQIHGLHEPRVPSPHSVPLSVGRTGVRVWSGARNALRTC